MIALFRGRGPIADLIRWQTRGEYSHAAWMCGDGSVIESHVNGGVLHEESPFVRNGMDADFDVFTVNCLTGAQCVGIQSFLLRQCGAKYDWLGIARFLAGVNRDNYDRWFCSELVAEGCEEIGRPLFHAPAWKISPETLSWSTEITRIESHAGVSWWERKFGKKAVVPEYFDDFDREALPA